MKATKWMTVIVLAGGVALGQAPSGAKSPAKPASQAPPLAAAKATAKAPAKAAANAGVKTAAATKAAAPKTAAPKKVAAASSAAAPAARKKAPMSAKPVVAHKEKAPSAAKPVEVKGITAPGKRDPFISVIVARGGPSADCSGGKRCLVPEQIALRGIIKTPTKWIAMIETPAKKTYYLYENDAIYNGVVAKITGDSVVFRVQALDNLGHVVPQDIVKRVNAPVI